MKNHGLGFTLVEVLLSMGIIAILLAVSSINLLGAKNKASLNSSVNVFITDLSQQQLKAMVGDTEGNPIGPGSYGVYFDPSGTKYWLFQGAGYNPADQYNFAVTLGDNLIFDPIPSTTIVFSKGSGETGSTYSVTIKNSNTQEQETITLNQYGIVTQLN